MKSPHYLFFQEVINDISKSNRTARQQNVWIPKAVVADLRNLVHWVYEVVVPLLVILKLWPQRKQCGGFKTSKYVNWKMSSRLLKAYPRSRFYLLGGGTWWCRDVWAVKGKWENRLPHTQPTPAAQWQRKPGSHLAESFIFSIIVSLLLEFTWHQKTWGFF